jgi:hypothetical protein
MLSQVNLWVERAATVLDVILVLRILFLKLHKTYLFVTLVAVLSVFYDAIGLVLGLQTPAFAKVEIFSKFLYAIVYPLALWDLFEEARGPVEKIRKLAMSRFIGSLVLITLWGLLMASFTGGGNDTMFDFLMRLNMPIWLGSVAAALAFIWVMKRGIKANSLTLPHNTQVWLRFFQWMLALEGALCLFELIFLAVPNPAGEMTKNMEDSVSVVAQLTGMAITGWCVVKLRRTPADISDVPVIAEH